MADSGLGAIQKIAQTLIIWLIPVFGMSLVLLLLGNGHTRDDMKRLVPFPFYLIAPAQPRDGALTPSAQDGYMDNCGDADGD